MIWGYPWERTYVPKAIQPILNSLVSDDRKYLLIMNSTWLLFLDFVAPGPIDIIFAQKRLRLGPEVTHEHALMRQK